jgi:anti-anti-sigma factor
MDILQESLSSRVDRIAPQGRLDAVTVPSLEAVFEHSISSGRVRLVVDLGAVNYISSSGLRALLSVRRQAQANGGDVVLCGMNSRVREVFEMIGFDKLFRVFDRVDEAAAALATALAA